MTINEDDSLKGQSSPGTDCTLHIEKLPEGFYLATSDDIPGLVAQGRTIAETLEIARDIAKKLLESHQERQTPIHLNDIEDAFDYPLIVGI